MTGDHVLCQRVHGHEVPRGFFRAAIEADRLSHAYLLVGPQGVGKRRFADELGAALLCRHGPLRACGDCVSCRTIASGNHPALELLAPPPGRYLEIDVIRGVIETLSLTAADRRVLILDDADRLGEEASHAFLKILEEPPPRVLFLLISSQPARLLDTIISRCHRVQFAALERADFEAVLVDQGITPDGLPLSIDELHAACAGSPGRALRLLEGIDECGGPERFRDLLAGVGSHRPESLIDYVPARSDEAKRDRVRRLLELVLEGTWGQRARPDSDRESAARRAQRVNELLRDLAGNQNPELILEDLALLLAG